MKNLNSFLITIFLVLSITATCFAQPHGSYTKNIKLAEQYYHDKAYIKAAQFYSKAFISNNNLGLVRDRYEAARCWALGGQADSAFYQLERAAKGNFGEYPEIIADTAFVHLRDDGRWATLTDAVKANRQTQNPNLAWQFKKLNKPLVAVLDTIYTNDQLVRKQENEIVQRYGRSSPEIKAHIVTMLRTDSINQDKVKHILDKNGWLGKEEVGLRGSDALFLVVQHASLPMQLQYLPLVRKAVKEGKIESSSLAMLEDRVALRQGKKQTYGSQLEFNNKTNSYYVQPIEDLENVDKRRAAVGLPPMKEYVSKWKINWSLEQYEKDLVEAENKQHHNDL